jgi:hypothetical protein
MSEITIPSRAFSREEDIEAFRRLLESKGIPLRRISKKGWLL